MKNWFLCVAMAAGIFLLAAVPAGAAIATGSAEITNIQYNMVNPADGTLDWFYDDGFGGPDWQGEAWNEVSDSFGGADAGYNTTPDGFGVINASASTAWANGSASVDLVSKELFSSISATNPVDGWVADVSYGMMFNYFSISPTIPGSTDLIDMTFSFDYEIHLTGQTEPGTSYFVDASVAMLLEYEDEFGDWQLVPDGQLFYTKIITGSGTDSDDVTFIGSLSKTVYLAPNTNYSTKTVTTEEVPEPTTLVLLGLGSLARLRKVRC